MDLEKNKIRQTTKPTNMSFTYIPGDEWPIGNNFFWPTVNSVNLDSQKLPPKVDIAMLLAYMTFLGKRVSDVLHPQEKVFFITPPVFAFVLKGTVKINFNEKELIKYGKDAGENMNARMYNSIVIPVVFGHKRLGLLWLDRNSSIVTPYLPFNATDRNSAQSILQKAVIPFLQKHTILLKGYTDVGDVIGPVVPPALVSEWWSVWYFFVRLTGVPQPFAGVSGARSPGHFLQNQLQSLNVLCLAMSWIIAECVKSRYNSPELLLTYDLTFGDTCTVTGARATAAWVAIRKLNTAFGKFYKNSVEWSREARSIGNEMLKAGYGVPSSTSSPTSATVTASVQTNAIKVASKDMDKWQKDIVSRFIPNKNAIQPTWWL